jgi:hypothetical protein
MLNGIFLSLKVISGVDNKENRKKEEEEEEEEEKKN